MSRIFFRFIILSILFCCNHVYAQTKHALIFAIGNYPAKGGWPVISSLNDVSYITQTLQKQGFDARNVKVIQDSMATVEGIKNALTDLLNNRVAAGDIVVIHFSCHGEQVEADNNNSTDGLDECVVSYNAVSPLLSTDFMKDQAGYLRGHELGKYLLELRKKLGPKGDVVVFLDFCHSGSGTRGLNKIRGGKPPLVSKNYNPQSHKKSDSSFITRQPAIVSNNASLASLEVISATRPEELNAETLDDKGTGVGSLSYAVSKAFETLPSGCTYNGLFSRIQAIMNIKVPSQHPLLEGNGGNRLLLGGRFMEQKPYIEVINVKQDQILEIKAGLLAGVDKGSVVAVYASGTANPAAATPLAKGTVTEAGNFTSIVELEKPLPSLQPAEAWVFVKEQAYNTNPVAVLIGRSAPTRGTVSNFSAEDIATLTSTLRAMPFVTLNNTPELLITKGPSADSLKIASNGYLFALIPNAIKDSATLKTRIQEYMRYKFLQSMETKEEGVEADVRLVPVLNGRADTANISKRMINGMYEFYDGDTVTIFIRNTGTRDIYVNILDLQPDGIINPILPMRDKNIYSYDLKIKAGSSFIFPAEKRLIISPPYGTEVFKVFTSTTEIDLEQIAITRGQATRGNLSALEKLVKSSYTITRGVTAGGIGKADGTTFSVMFRIKARM